MNKINKNKVSAQYTWLSGKESACNSGDSGDVASIPGSGKSHGVGNSNPLQYSCPENVMDSGAWWAIVHGVTNSWTRLSTHTHTHTHTHSIHYKRLINLLILNYKSAELSLK